MEPMTLYSPFGMLSRLGAWVTGLLVGMGQFTRFSLATIGWMFAAPSSWLSWRRLAPPLYSVGVLSIPVVGITGMFIGMILALEAYGQFHAIGIDNRMGGVINSSVVKQIGPVLAAVMVAGRVGGALAAELGTMRVTEQLDAMRAMSVDPVRNLVVPRFVACVVMTPVLTIYSNALGVWGAWIMVVKVYGVNSADYWYYTGIVVHWWDPIAGLFKSLFFGAAIGLIACWKGFNCDSGASGVGKAATAAFVASFLAIIAINFVLADFLNEIYSLLFPTGIRSAFV
ncbi:MAG: ABC transporter permease [Phycisphaerales bacterium]|nr:ABC transporter permease [Phycisphaerales bacterium]